jgi:hypothetical protein
LFGHCARTACARPWYGMGLGAPRCKLSFALASAQDIPR